MGHFFNGPELKIFDLPVRERWGGIVRPENFRGENQWQ
jgi:hypothetical protein